MTMPPPSALAEERIHDIPVSAPLFRGTPPAVLFLIVEKLSSASYHFADDSGREWGRGQNDLFDAVQLCIKHRISYDAMLHLHAHAPQLVGFDQFMQRLLRTLYEAQS